MHRLTRYTLTALALAATAIPASSAAAQATPAPAAAQPAANPADVGSLDAILAALYDVISGPAGQARNWDRFRSLFIPGARLIPSTPNAEGKVVPRVLDPDGYATRAASTASSS